MPAAWAALVRAPGLFILSLIDNFFFVAIAVQPIQGIHIHSGYPVFVCGDSDRPSSRRAVGTEG